jgi:hypothetical protein
MGWFFGTILHSPYSVKHSGARKGRLERLGYFPESS